MNDDTTLIARGFAGRSDYHKMAGLLQEMAVADGTGTWTTAEAIEHDYQHLVNSTPETDMLMVENAQGTLVAYARVGWNADDEGRQVFMFPFNIHPTYRTLDLHRHLLRWVATRGAALADRGDGAKPPILRAVLPNIDRDTVHQQALEAEAFQPVRYMYRMLRDLSRAVVPPPLPAGLDVRPVPETHYWAAVQALDEAFRDHWGHVPLPEEAFEQVKGSPQFRPDLWQVAWDGDEIAAGVFNWVDDEANAQHNLKRGWTDPIFTRRPWRKRGLARALLMRSLKMFQNMGLTEAVLGVDTQNPNGALNLYESCGFEVEFCSVVYEKPVLAPA